MYMYRNAIQPYSWIYMSVSYLEWKSRKKIKTKKRWQWCWWHHGFCDLTLVTNVKYSWQKFNLWDIFWSVTNIFNVSPTHSVSNNRHQHRILSIEWIIEFWDFLFWDDLCWRHFWAIADRIGHHLNSVYKIFKMSPN